MPPGFTSGWAAMKSRKACVSDITLAWVARAKWAIRAFLFSGSENTLCPSIGS